MENYVQDSDATTIFDVLRVDLCARAILDYVPIRELVRSERVCRRWQGALRDYLQGCNTLQFYDVKIPYLYLTRKDSLLFSEDNIKGIDRNIVIPFDCNTLLACKNIEKWGPFVVKLTTERERYTEECYQTIACHCPKLKHIQIGVFEKGFRNCYFNLLNKLNKIQQITLHYHCFVPSLEKILGKSFQNIDCEKIKTQSRSITGSFLKFVKPRDFKSLSLLECVNLSIPDLLCATEVIRNITSMALDKNFQRVLENIHLLLNEMTQLEEVSLRDYSRHIQSFGEESVEAFSRLSNLKHLDMMNNGSVTDALLEALARGCKKLEYLDIRGCQLDCVGKGTVSARGLSALCHRSPATVTIIHFGYFECTENLRDKDEDIKEVLNKPVMQEIKAYCRVEPTIQWFKAACMLWISRGGRIPLELQSGCNPIEAQDSRQKLKIMLMY